MKFSLLIATLNRPKLLSECVQSLLEQSYDDFEIIIIDQSDEDKKSSELYKIDARIKYIHIRQRGLSHARNIGIEKCNGDYVCLIDDDGIYEIDYLEKMRKIICELKPTIIGCQLQDPNTSCYKYETVSYYVKYQDAFSCFCSPGMVIDANFQKKHLYDEQFGVGSKYGSGEETDIVLIAINNSKKVYYASNIIVKHPVETMETIPPLKMESYSYGYGALCKKIFSCYSKFWGIYFLSRTVLGNMFFGLFSKYLINKQKAGNTRINRALKTYEGFKDYKVII